MSFAEQAIQDLYDNASLRESLGTGREQISLPASTFYFGRSIRGTFIGDCNPVTDTPKILDWYSEGKLAIDPLITHRIPLEEINSGFDLMKSGKAIRTVVVF
jgi:S-(hydroxymethyl)glutathione dehydrogenase/alcohol dehydrogenase